MKLRSSSSKDLFPITAVLALSAVLSCAECAPRLLGRVAGINGTQTLGIAVAGNKAYIANQYSGLRVYDVSIPFLPRFLCSTNDGGLAWSVGIAKRFAYVANGEDGLRIYDISNPRRVKGVGHVAETMPAAEAHAVAIDGKYAYVANAGDGLRVYDVSDPHSPTNVGFASAGIGSQSLVVAGSYLYIADGTEGLEVCDIANPANPVLVNSIAEGLPVGVAAAHGYLYSADWYTGFWIYDLSVPTNPVPVSHFQSSQGQGTRLFDTAYTVTVAGRFAYVANDVDGIGVYDVSNPENPNLVGLFPHTDVSCVAVADHKLLTADRFDGFTVFWLPSCLWQHKHSVRLN